MMKKLLFITWSVSYGYGTEKSLADVLNGMDGTEYEISILPLFKYAESTIFAPRIRILDALIDYTAENFDEQRALDNYYSLLASPLKFNKLVKEKYDCVIACNHNAPSYFASYIKTVPKAVWVRGDLSELDPARLPEGSTERASVEREHAMQANVFKCFDRIAVISESVRKALSTLFGITENVCKINNSVDFRKITELCKERVDLPDKVIFTTLGRLDDNKNQMLLLRAAKLLRAERDDFFICILGDGVNRKAVESYIEDNGLGDTVAVKGFVSNPYPYIRKSAATVLTSFSEGFSLVLVESVMLNTPVISTPVGVAEELIDKYACGDIIGYDEKEIKEILLKYIKNYDGYKHVFDIGNEYDLATEIKETVSLIEETMNTPSALPRMRRLPYREVTIVRNELKNHRIAYDDTYVLRVIEDGVPYEYLINRKSSSDKLVVFNNGAVAEGNVTVPVFQRHSWASFMETSCVFCMDPTLYLNGFLQLGWGIGKNDNYYLEKSSLILRDILALMKIRPEDSVIFGTSAGGFLSVIMGIYLKGAKVVADNAQLDVRNWIFKDALDSVITFAFDNVSDALAYGERFDAVTAFEKHGYVPNIYIHVNLCSPADNEKQLVPFLEHAAKMRGITEYNDAEVYLHYSPDKGHNGINTEEAVDFLYKVLGHVKMPRHDP